VRPLLGALVALVLFAASAGSAAAAPGQEATFQDDDLLIYADTPRVTQTLDELRGLGVDRLRITLVWRAIAPGNEQDVRPAGFDAADPAAYPPGAWDRWDRVLRLARERGMDVNFNVTVPAPDWATASPERSDIDPTYEPSAEELGLFVRAAATRYDGAHGHPRVDYWSIQNEPNQPGWLTPQWVLRGDAWIEAAPRIYRAMVDAAYAALVATGHGEDTILIGETAPKGVRTTRGETRAIDALRFIRRLYCLDDNLQVLQGAEAEAQGCPPSDQIAQFPGTHPGLFRATGWAHHPYELVFAPNRRPTWRDWATMANLDDLQGMLRRIHLRYNQPLQGDVPLFLTEFGYQTKPEDPLGVSRSTQAAYLNQAEWIAWRNRDVRTLAQFLLRDDDPPASRTFQSGLRTVAGARKEAWAAYRFPIHVARPTLRRGQRLSVWGLPRPAADGSRPRVQVEFRRSGTRRWRRIGTVRGDRVKGYVSASLRAPGTGLVRLRWNRLTSRSVQVRSPARRTAR
jgi:hypothetical protein